MKKKIWKAFINFEKEEKWLNEMASKGLNFESYSFMRYTLEEGTPGEYEYRIELLKNMPGHPESKAYIEFMEEAGIECVDTYFRWVYFRKKKSEGSFDLYTDYESRIKHYKRVAAFTGIIAVMNLIAAVNNLYIGLTIGRRHGHYGNAYISIISWIIVLLTLPLLLSFIRKIRKMKKEKQLYE